MSIDLPAGAMLLTIMLLAIALILQTFHFGSRLSSLEQKITELAKQLSQQRGSMS